MSSILPATKWIRPNLLLGAESISQGSGPCGYDGEHDMYQDVDEQVEVIALFSKGKLNPLRFRWNGRVVKIVRITGTWKANAGAYKIRHFAAVDEASNFFQLAYDERTTSWTLVKVWVE